jgi:hypothetical protein
MEQVSGSTIWSWAPRRQASLRREAVLAVCVLAEVLVFAAPALASSYTVTGLLAWRSSQ